MALPIKDTPVLKGDDALKFFDTMLDDNKPNTTVEEYKDAFELYEKLTKINSSLVVD